MTVHPGRDPASNIHRAEGKPMSRTLTTLRKLRTALAVAAVGLALAGCAYPYTPPALPSVTLPAPPASPLASAVPAGPVTILVSIDGFRPDYLRQGNTPNLDAAAAAGVEAPMRPSFPTLTFPNHYTLVTGLRPDRHGVVDNTMTDPRRPGVQFKISDPKQTGDRFWWDEAEPIWVAAERAGLRTGVMFWPGSDAAIGGVRPSIWVPYTAYITSPQRVRFVLDWLRRPAAERPTFETLYFDVVDKRSHEQGYYSPEKTAAIREVDAAIGQLRDGLAAQGTTANLVIVADHGMEAVPPGHELAPSDFLPDASRARIVVGGPTLQVYPVAGQDAGVAAQLLRPRPHARCWRKADIPARLHFGRNPRVAPFYCLADSGWRFTTEPPLPFAKGDHGFDNADPAMRALFIAVGPAFRPGRRMGEFDNVDVYPLLRQLIGLPPAPGLDGSAARFGAVMRKGER